MEYKTKTTIYDDCSCGEYKSKCAKMCMTCFRNSFSPTAC